jgi:hypothetical protein
MMAVYEGHEDLVKELIQRGASTEIRNDRGDGALDWAFKFQRLGIARAIAEGDRARFAAAASEPAASWGPAVRSVPAPASGPPPAPGKPAPVDENARQLAELQQIREILVQRGMTDAVGKLDARIAAVKARPARAAPAPSSSPQLEELARIRETLASRGMTQSVEQLDRRIAALKARMAQEDLPGATVLEITARRDRPEEQSTRLIDAETPMP